MRSIRGSLRALRLVQPQYRHESYTLEGKKTVLFEVAKQFGWNVPDVLVVSVGDGYHQRRV